MLRKIIFFIGCFLLTVVLSGQSDSLSSLKQALVISKLSHPVNFDGIPDEEAWNSVDPVKLIMFTPVFGNEPTEETDFRIAYDDKFLYAGAWVYYKDTSLMRSAGYKRDYTGMGGDWIGLILDSYNDKENGLMFFTNPDGLRFDSHIQRDAVVNQPDQQPMNLSWNTFWDGLSRQRTSLCWISVLYSARNTCGTALK